LQDPARKGPFLLQDLAFAFLQDGFFWVVTRCTIFAVENYSG